MKSEIKKVNGHKHSCSEKKRRKRIWEINSDLFCSVCGTCLGLDEQRDILKKLKINAHEYEDYEIHGLMVQSCYSQNKLSIRLDNWLNKKYHYEISKYSALTEKEIVALWQECINNGDICGLYWVSATHPGLSEEIMHKMFCQVHMLSHLNGDIVRREKAECQQLRDRNNVLLQKVNEERQTRKKLSREMLEMEKTERRLRVRITELEKGFSDLSSNGEREKEQLDELKIKNIELSDENKCLQKQVNEYADIIKRLQNESEAAKEELIGQKQLSIQLCHEIEKILDQINSCDRPPCGKGAAEVNNCSKRVLIVGGLTKMKDYYRNIVEKKGAAFDYHDGYMCSGEKGLEERIRQSDVVLCPVDCNSHGACLSVKKICKKFNKSYHMLSNSSLNSITKAMERMGA